DAVPGDGARRVQVRRQGGDVLGDLGIGVAGEGEGLGLQGEVEADAGVGRARAAAARPTVEAKVQVGRQQGVDAAEALDLGFDAVHGTGDGDGAAALPELAVL